MMKEILVYCLLNRFCVRTLHNVEGLVSGYHEYMGGYHEYIRGSSVHRGYHDACGDIMSTSGNVQYIMVFNINQRLL